MTGTALQQHEVHAQQYVDVQLARYETAEVASRSVMDAWLRKLRLQGGGDNKQRGTTASPSSPPQCDAQPKRKQPSFIRALFKPHELTAVKNSSANADKSSSSNSKKKSYSRAPESNQALDYPQRQLWSRTKPVEIPSTSSVGRNGMHSCVTVGGRRVPFTRDAHRRMRKKSVKALACIAETHPISSLGSMSAAAYRSRAYYPAAATSSPSKQRKEKR